MIPVDAKDRTANVTVYHGDELATYGFGHGHPFGSDRQAAFWAGMNERGLTDHVDIAPPVKASRQQIERFHTTGYVGLVVERSVNGTGFLDYGDTPAFPGVYDAAAWVVGTTIDGVRRVVDGGSRRAFVPIAGLHHARRDSAGGFCVFNDCGVAIECLRLTYGIRRVAYVDIDAHHGDGVLYAFESDPEVFIADIHEDGRFLYPGTGWANERGSGPAEGTKLNLPLLPGAGDDAFLEAWELAERHLDDARPEIVILQCGADGLAGDPLTHLEYSPAVHRHATARLCALADRHCGGRIVALGGGGYNPRGLADGWCEVVAAMIES